jgi:hypothetical protein
MPRSDRRALGFALAAALRGMPGSGPPWLFLVAIDMARTPPACSAVEARRLCGAGMMSLTPANTGSQPPSERAAKRPPITRANVDRDQAARIARAAIEEAAKLERQASKAPGEANAGRTVATPAWYDLEAAFRRDEAGRGNVLTDSVVDELARALTRADAPPEVKARRNEWIARLTGYARAAQNDEVRIRALSALARRIAPLELAAARKLWDDA